MTTDAVTARLVTVTILGTSTALTFTPESIEAPDGMQHMELWRFAQNAIEDLLTIPWSGETFSDGTWEIQITMKPSD